MTLPHQHFQEMSTPAEGGTASHSHSTTSDNTHVEGTSSSFAAREMVRQRIQEVSQPSKYRQHAFHLA